MIVLRGRQVGTFNSVDWYFCFVSYLNHTHKIYLPTGLCVVLVGHPFDLIKVRMQTGATAGSASVFGMLATTFRTEGIRGIYRGVSAPITAVTPLFAVSFWGYDMGKRMISAFQEFRTGHPIQTFTIVSDNDMKYESSANDENGKG